MTIRATSGPTFHASGFDHAGVPDTRASSAQRQGSAVGGNPLFDPLRTSQRSSGSTSGIRRAGAELLHAFRQQRIAASRTASNVVNHAEERFQGVVARFQSQSPWPQFAYSQQYPNAARPSAIRYLLPMMLLSDASSSLMMAGMMGSMGLGGGLMMMPGLFTGAAAGLAAYALFRRAGHARPQTSFSSPGVPYTMPPAWSPDQRPGRPAFASSPLSSAGRQTHPEPSGFGAPPASPPGPGPNDAGRPAPAPSGDPTRPAGTRPSAFSRPEPSGFADRRPSAAPSGPIAPPPASPRPDAHDSTTEPAGQATASSAASGAQAPDPTAHEQLGVPEGADWRHLLKMDGRVLPKEVTSQAQTRAGIEKMRAEIDKAEAEMRNAHKKLLIKFHPDKHFGKDMTKVIDLISTAVNQCEKEFRDARGWLDRQSRNVTA
jgi:hypothetical protein